MIKLSVFPKTKVLPVSKEEKRVESFNCSKPNLPDTISISTEDDLISTITNNAWSPNVFSSYRNQENFVQCDMLVLDIDNGMTLEESYEIVKNLNVSALAMPSTSHTEENHRFRIIFPLSRAIVNKDENSATMNKLVEYFPADPSCVHDYARYYFGCKDGAGYWHESKLLVPTKAPKQVIEDRRMRSESTETVIVGESIEELIEALYGEPRAEVPEQIAFFLEEAPTGLEGMWNNSANNFLFTAALMGAEYDRIAEVFETVAPESLDKYDILMLDRSTKAGYTAREEDAK